MSNPTYLRVKRRRNAGTALTLRLEGLGNDLEEALALEDLALSQDVKPKPLKNRKRAAIWRRVEAEPVDRKRAFHVVDALLDDEPVEQSTQQSKKRRRITLLDSAEDSKSLFLDKKPRAKVNGYKILNPAERLVDDSLKNVHSGELTVRQHVNFITLDPRLADESRTWLAWCNEEGGNILHACALWNDVVMATDLVSRNLEGLSEALDGENRTPYEAAELAGNRRVAEVLEAFGADMSNYVYDVYCLEVNDAETDDQSQDVCMSCELQGGVGYWNEHGDLILEKQPLESEIAAEIDDEHDVDSNHEDWAGNDYPEDQGWVDSSDDELLCNSFRRRAARIENDSFDDEDNFDSAYGIYGQVEPDFD